jgi:hypothetical protein
MIDQLLDLTRIRLGKGIPIERTHMDLGQICTAIVEELRASHEGLEIQLQLSGDLTGEWDPDRLAQLVSNLGGNACAHGKPPIRIIADGQNELEVLLRVENGGTIRPEVVPTLFEPWTRRRGAAGSGLGLGLYISREIAHLHAGSIEKTADQPDTTCFAVRLPRSASR